MFRQIIVIAAVGLASLNLASLNVAYAQQPEALSIQWHNSPSTAFAEAEASGRPVLVFVGTQWCHYCKIMQTETWNHPTIVETLAKNFIALKLDGDRDQSIVAPLKLSGYPATLVYTSQGQPVVKHEGKMSAAQTYAWLVNSYRDAQTPRVANR